MERFTKRIMPERRRITRNFSGKGRFCGSRAPRKTFCQKHQKKRPILEFFLLDTLKTTFLIENLTQRWMQSGLFPPKKSGHFFRFSRKGKGGLLPLPSCAPVSVT